LIDDLLDVCRGSCRANCVSSAPASTSTTSSTTLCSGATAADAKEVQISVAADPKVGAIHGDNARLQQVVSNLLSNALKFTPRGGSVIVQVTRSLDCVELQVRDSGRVLPRVSVARLRTVPSGRRIDDARARRLGWGCQS
jgi:signal transduction histidine kinase